MNDLEKLKVGFFGTPDFALKILEKLKTEKINIKYVVSQAPKPSGRGQKIQYSKVHAWANYNNLKVFTPESSNDKNFIKTIKEIEVDLIIVVAYGHIINEEILDIPKLMCINVHASILPKWRGAAPIQRAILNGDKKTGISIMKVERNLDTGPVLLKESINILNTDCSGDLHEKLSKVGSKLIIKAIEEIFHGNYRLSVQNEKNKTYAKKIKKGETKIKWDCTAEYNHRFIRAFNPWPGAWTYMNQEKKFRIKILETIIVKDEFSSLKKPGFCSELLIVKCKKNSLKILRLQKEGKRIMNRNEFMNGFCTKSCMLE